MLTKICIKLIIPIYLILFDTISSQTDLYQYIKEIQNNDNPHLIKKAMVDTYNNKTSYTILVWYLMSYHNYFNVKEMYSFVKENPFLPIKKILINMESKINDDYTPDFIVSVYEYAKPVTRYGITHYIRSLLSLKRFKQAKKFIRSKMMEGKIWLIDEFRDYLSDKQLYYFAHRFIYQNQIDKAQSMIRCLSSTSDINTLNLRIDLVEQQKDKILSLSTSKIIEYIQTYPDVFYDIMNILIKSERYNTMFNIVINDDIAHILSKSDEIHYKYISNIIINLAINLSNSNMVQRACSLLLKHKDNVYFIYHAKAFIMLGLIHLYKYSNYSAAYQFFRSVKKFSNDIEDISASYFLSGLSLSKQSKNPNRMYAKAAIYTNTFYGLIAFYILNNSQLNNYIFHRNCPKINYSLVLDDNYKYYNIMVGHDLNYLARMFIMHLAKLKSFSCMCSIIKEGVKSDYAVPIILSNMYKKHLRQPVIESFSVTPIQMLRQNIKAPVSKEIVAAIIRQESCFNTNLNLMQLEGDLNNNVHTIEDNIESGSRYIYNLYRRFKKYYISIAAYNMGETKIAHIINKTTIFTKDKTPPLYFIEFIPNKITSHYVKSVLHYLWIYCLIYSNNSSDLSIKQLNV